MWSYLCWPPWLSWLVDTRSVGMCGQSGRQHMISSGPTGRDLPGLQSTSASWEKNTENVVKEGKRRQRCNISRRRKHGLSYVWFFHSHAFTSPPISVNMTTSSLALCGHPQSSLGHDLLDCTRLQLHYTSRRRQQWRITISLPAQLTDDPLGWDPRNLEAKSTH